MIKTQLWTPKTCDCVIMLKWDTEITPTEWIHITADEYVELMRARQGEANIHPIDKVMKFASRIKTCSLHEKHISTKKIVEELIKHHKEESEKRRKFSEEILNG